LLQLAFSTEYHWLPRELELLALRPSAVCAVERPGSWRTWRAQSRSASWRAHDAVEEKERRRISRELHDEAGIAAVYPPEAGNARQDAREPLRQSLAETVRYRTHHRRDPAYHRGVESAVLEQLGLAAALARWPTGFAVFTQQRPAHYRRPGRPARETEIATFRLVQECFHTSPNILGFYRNLSLHRTDGLLS